MPDQNKALYTVAKARLMTHYPGDGITNLVDYTIHRQIRAEFIS